MRKLLILSVLLLMSGCAAQPYIEGRAAYLHEPWSDWVFETEREWIPDKKEVSLHLQVGFEWPGRIDCPYFDVVMAGPWDQTFIGCSKGIVTTKRDRKFQYYLNMQLMHQIDSRTAEFLRTDQKQWQGHNPFLHLRGGMDWLDGRIKCPTIATGKSLFQGAPFERETGAPDLSWFNWECSVRKRWR